MIPFKPRLGRPGPMFICNTTGLWEFPRSFAVIQA
jgi:hypothetical protein